MKARKLTQREFARAIRNGLGSAFLHIATYGDDGVEIYVREACTRNLIYDKQLENGRADWLTNMIVRSNRLDFYADEIKVALDRVPRDRWDLEPLVWLAVNLFELGYSDFAEALLDLFRRHSTPDEYSTSLLCALVNVAGLGGLRMGVHWLIAECDEDGWDLVELARHAKNFFEKDSIEEVFAGEATGDPEISTFVVRVNAFNKLWKNGRAKRRLAPSLTLSEVIELARSATRHGYIPGLVEFGQHATNGELLDICTQLEQENNAASLCAYLEVFRKRPLPRVSRELLRLMYSLDERVRAQSLLRFAGRTNALLRAEACRLVQSDNERDISAAFKLLEANYVPEDSERFEQAIAKVRSADQLHSVSRSVREIEKHWPSEDFTESLLYLFYHCPCGSCRRTILQALIRRGAVPAQVAFEAQWDANEQVQQVARQFVREGALHEG